MYFCVTVMLTKCNLCTIFTSFLSFSLSLFLMHSFGYFFFYSGVCVVNGYWLLLNSHSIGTYATQMVNKIPQQLTDHLLFLVYFVTIRKRCTTNIRNSLALTYNLLFIYFRTLFFSLSLSLLILFQMFCLIFLFI